MTKNEQIDGIFGVIDLWASNAVRKRPDGDSVYNPYNAKELAVELYNADYRKADEIRKETVKEIIEILKGYNYDGEIDELIDIISKKYGIRKIKTMIKKEQIDKIDELQKQVDELIEERENMQSEIIATEEARLQAVKDTAKEICDLILEYWKVDDFVDCNWVIEVISEKYGVDMK